MTTATAIIAHALTLPGTAARYSELRTAVRALSASFVATFPSLSEKDQAELEAGVPAMDAAWDAAVEPLFGAQLESLSAHLMSAA